MFHNCLGCNVTTEPASIKLKDLITNQIKTTCNECKMLPEKYLFTPLQVYIKVLKYCILFLKFSLYIYLCFKLFFVLIAHRNK